MEGEILLALHVLITMEAGLIAGYVFNALCPPRRRRRRRKGTR
jgi:hypothetical protein